MSRIRLKLKGGAEPTAEEVEWLARAERILNHPENAMKVYLVIFVPPGYIPQWELMKVYLDKAKAEAFAAEQRAKIRGDEEIMIDEFEVADSGEPDIVRERDNLKAEAESKLQEYQAALRRVDGCCNCLGHGKGYDDGRWDKLSRGKDHRSLES